MFILFQSSLIPFMAVSMLDVFGSSGTAEILHIIFTLIDPPYAFYGGLQYISRVSIPRAVLMRVLFCRSMWHFSSDKVKLVYHI